MKAYKNLTNETSKFLKIVTTENKYIPTQLKHVVGVYFDEDFREDMRKNILSEGLKIRPCGWTSEIDQHIQRPLGIYLSDSELQYDSPQPVVYVDIADLDVSKLFVSDCVLAEVTVHFRNKNNPSITAEEYEQYEILRSNHSVIPFTEYEGDLAFPEFIYVDNIPPQLLK